MGYGIEEEELEYCQRLIISEVAMIERTLEILKVVTNITQLATTTARRATILKARRMFSTM
jgi:hypothetical protein